jgi:ketosteroid isomerase-like protein
MLAGDAGFILGDLYRAWERGDLADTLSYFSSSVAFAVHSADNGTSLIGEGIGRTRFGKGLDHCLARFKVCSFALGPVSVRGPWVQSKAMFVYRDRITGTEIDGTMRHLWRFIGDEIAHFELFYDSPRMRAFYELAALESAR